MTFTGTVGVVAVYTKLLRNIPPVCLERHNDEPVAKRCSKQANQQYAYTGKLYHGAKVNGKVIVARNRVALYY
jgi:hypothetical protein